MNIVLTGSIAFDYLMTFPGQFKDHILLEKLDRLSLSFLVDSLVRRRGGIATNIAYTMALLGERPVVMGTVGKDFGEYQALLESLGVETGAIRVISDLYTASFFVSTDQSHAQIASFYPGAMSRAAELRFADLEQAPDLAIISANDPVAMDQYVAECKRSQIPFIYDPSQQTVRVDGETLLEGIQGSMALFVNDYELGLIEEKTGRSAADLLQMTEFMVITKGEQGADIHAQDGIHSVPSVSPAKLKDPTGVGDAFRAGFLKGYLRQLPLDLCAQLGAVSASYCLECDGPQGHEFTLEEFLDRFHSNFPDQGDLVSLA